MAICYNEPKADLVVFFLYNILNGIFDTGRLSFFAGTIVSGYGPQICPRVWNFYGNPKTSERTTVSEDHKYSRQGVNFI